MRDTAYMIPYREFRKELLSRVRGQEKALTPILDAVALATAGYTEYDKPLLSGLLLGPTGVGKTRTVEAVSEILHGRQSIVKVDCAEFQHSHEIAKLIGSPPGYLGHRETHPVLTQEALNEAGGDCKVAVVLFDEIEKASDALWQLLLGILDKAALTLGDNRKVSFARAMIFMTSNVGAAELAAVDRSIGFCHTEKSAGIALEAMRRKFSPEFLNRLDFQTVYEPLTKESLEDILELELQAAERLVEETLHVSADAKRRLIEAGYDPRYGARHLKRAIRQQVLLPLARYRATGARTPVRFQTTRQGVITLAAATSV